MDDLLASVALILLAEAFLLTAERLLFATRALFMAVRFTILSLYRLEATLEFLCLTVLPL
jgi:hypothetical protein